MDRNEKVIVMPALPSVRKNMFYASIAYGFFALTQWGIVVVLSRIGTPEDVGTLTVLTALITPIFLLANMDMRNGHSADDLTDFSPTDYYALRLWSSFFAILIIALIAFTYLDSSGAFVQISAIAYSAVKFFGAQINMNHGVFQRAERMDFVARSLLCQGAFGLTAFTLGYHYSSNLSVAFLSEATAWCLSLVLIDRQLLSSLGKRIRFGAILDVPFSKIIRLARWTIPLGLAVFLMASASSIPRLVLERYVDISAVGVFGAIAYINIALNIVGNAIGSSSSARLRRLYRSGSKIKFLRLSLILSLLAACIGGFLCLFVYLFGEKVLTLMYGVFYANVEVFKVTILAAAIRLIAAPLQFSVNAGQAFWWRMLNNSAVFSIAVFSSMLLVPDYGLIGAAWTMVVLSALHLLLSLVALYVVVGKIELPKNKEIA